MLNEGRTSSNRPQGMVHTTVWRVSVSDCWQVKSRNCEPTLIFPTTMILVVYKCKLRQPDMTLGIDVRKRQKSAGEGESPLALKPMGRVI